MTYQRFLIGLLLVGFLIILPAGAFTARDLTITVRQNGDAQVDFTYDLNLVEQVAVFAKITEPTQELKSVLENNFYNSVDITTTTSTSTSLTIHSFATVRETQGGTVYTTPSLSFENAERVLSQYWFSPLVSPALSPDTTTVIFPDGQTEVRYNSLSIPSFTKIVRL